MNVSQPITDFAPLAEPPGGDQVFLTRCSHAACAEPIAISDPHRDLYKPAVAVDGSGHVWVFWSENKDGNFDLYARMVEGGRAGKTERLTTDPGADIAPAATTDAEGHVWVAWQAFRNGLGQIHALPQKNTSFGSEIVVASSSSDEWNPVIAAAPGGGVAIAWDTYRKGDYDVYFRTLDASGELGPETPVAASLRYEAYPSITYDLSGRLWIAWEESDEGWGKDFGAYQTTGIALYQGRWVRVRVWDKSQPHTAGDLDLVLPGIPSWRVDSMSRQSDPVSGTQPDPDIAEKRKPNQPSQPPLRPLNNFPRLLADGNGRIWLAYRTPQPVWWSHLGTVWFENVVSFDGASWSNPIFIPHSDNLLDNRPALVSTAPGELLIVHSSDGRQQFPPLLRTLKEAPAQMGPENERKAEMDLYYNQLYLTRLVLPAKVASPQLMPARPSEVATAAASPEAAAVRRLREYRARLGRGEYQILRGEFHRHTEVSTDGGRDGTLFDTWRYALDTAALEWIGCCDHDNGSGREYSWWTNQKLDDIFLIPGRFTPMFNYERSVSYPEGHRNIIMAQRGVRTLPRLPRVQPETPGNAPDTQMLYAYLRYFDGVVGSHTSGTSMGTDWRDNDTLREPVVEIYQGLRQSYEMPEAPRANRANDSLGGYRPKGYISLALDKGYLLGFEASSDHVSTHMSYTMLYATGTDRRAVLEALKKRRVYAATDNILADVRCGDHLMGEQFESAELPTLKVKLIGTAPFAQVHVVKDGRYVYAAQPKTAEVEFTWQDLAAEDGKQSYYYVRGEQQDGQVVWASPFWITYRAH
jgi:hypothetical protein